jgi:hypothetical protein
MVKRAAADQPGPQAGCGGKRGWRAGFRTMSGEMAAATLRPERDAGR